MKGWCPGALRPMTSGDGLVVRVRARCGAFSVTEMSALARAAAEHGNGHIDITRRANLQIRGVTEESFPKLIDRLGQLGLLDVSAGVEAIRNFMIAPLTGLDPAAADVRPVVHELARLLATDECLAGAACQVRLRHRRRRRTAFDGRARRTFCSRHFRNGTAMLSALMPKADRAGWVG